MQKTDFPASIFLSVASNAITQAIEIRKGEYRPEDFRRFIEKQLTDPGEGKFYPDNWIFRYKFPNAHRIPPLALDNDNNRYFKTVRLCAEQEGISPAQVIPLRDALYCRQYGIDILAAEGRHDQVIKYPGYNMLKSSFGDRGRSKAPDTNNRVFRTCRAVDIGIGVLLYDFHTSAGREAYTSLMKHCANHFFDKELNIEKIKLYDLHQFFPIEIVKPRREALNFNFNHYGRDTTFEYVCKLPLFDSAMLKEAIPVREYDMHPLSENYGQFLNGEQVSPQPPAHTFDIGILDQISRNGYPTERLSPELRFYSSYISDFRDLADKIVLCDNPSEMAKLQKEAQKRAQQFLDKDFPNRRCMPAVSYEQDLIPLRTTAEPSFHSLKP